MARPLGSQNKDKPFREALRMELAAMGDDLMGLRQVARALINKAIAGETPAAKEIADRLDGKPAQPIENGDEGAFELIHRIERTIVHAHDPHG